MRLGQDDHWSGDAIMPQTILITGASSQASGKVTAQLFHKQGWNVIATMRSPEKETELSQLENVLVTRLDVTDEASITTAVAERDRAVRPDRCSAEQCRVWGLRAVGGVPDGRAFVGNSTPTSSVCWP